MPPFVYFIFVFNLLANKDVYLCIVAWYRVYFALLVDCNKQYMHQ